MHFIYLTVSIKLMLLYIHTYFVFYFFTNIFIFINSPCIKFHSSCFKMYLFSYMGKDFQIRNFIYVITKNSLLEFLHGTTDVQRILLNILQNKMIQPVNRATFQCIREYL